MATRSSFALAAFLIFLGHHSSGQEAAPERSAFTYFNSFHSGALLGDSGKEPTVSFSMIHGLRWKRYSAGAGIGFDNYVTLDANNFFFQRYLQLRVFPVFANVTADIIEIKDNAIFLQFQGGYSFFNMVGDGDESFDYREDNGRTFSPALGYRIRTDKLSLYFVAGYKWQIHRYAYSPRWLSTPGNYTSVRQTIERVSVSIGFGWNR